MMMKYVMLCLIMLVKRIQMQEVVRLLITMKKKIKTYREEVKKCNAPSSDNPESK